MPCNDGGGVINDTRVETSLRKTNKRMEIMLCSACRTLERLEYDFDENPELSEWWADHKKKDEERVRAETAKRLEQEQVKIISEKKFIDLTAADRQLLKKHGYL